MKKKKLKIKWGNVIKSVIFIGCITLILHDVYMLTIYSWITGILAGWTWFGLLTFVLCIGIAGLIYDDFIEQIEKTSATRND